MAALRVVVKAFPRRLRTENERAGAARVATERHGKRAMPTDA